MKILFKSDDMQRIKIFDTDIETRANKTRNTTLNMA